MSSSSCKILLFVRVSLEKDASPKIDKLLSHLEKAGFFVFVFCCCCCHFPSVVALLGVGNNHKNGGCTFVLPGIPYRTSHKSSRDS